MATTLKEFVIILCDNKRPDYISPDKIIGKRARELKVVLNIGKGYTLAIRTPTFVQFIEPDTIVTDLCKNLVREDPFDFSYSLQIISKSEKNTIYFILHNEVDNTLPNTTTPMPMPDFIVSFTLMEYNQKPGKYVLDKIENCYQLPVTNTELYINSEKVDFSNQSAKDIIKKLRFEGNDTVFKCHLTEEALKITEKRVHPMKELVKTEADFLERLNFLIHHFKPKMETAGLLAKYNGQCETFFKCCKDIFKFHTSFYTSLTSMKIDYSTRISFSFFQMGNGFLINRDFIRQYGKIQKVATEIRSNVKLAEIEQTVYSNEKIAFDQYISAPFQRPLKYPLLLREILKTTPTSHIDYRFVLIAESTMKGLCQQIDKYCDQIKNVAQMVQITNRINDPEVQLIGKIDTANEENERSLKSMYEVKVRKKEEWEKKMKTGMLYLLSDKLLCTQKLNSRRESVLFYKKIKNMQFIVSADKEANSIFFIIDIESSFNVVFEREEEKDDFITKFRQLRQNFMILKPNQIFAEEIITTKQIPQTVGNSAATLNDTLVFIAGGISSKSKDGESIMSPLMIFDTKNNEISVNNDVVSPSNSMKMAVASPMKEKACVSLYLFGGRKYDQVLIYMDNCWTALPGKAGFTRMKHSMVAYKDNLVIFGGIDGNDKATNEIIMYNVTKHSWYKPLVTHKLPSPRFGHSAVIYKNSMIIHGGTLQDEKLDDTWIFSFDQNVWAQIKLQKNNAIVPRSGHGAVIVNQFMVVFGGEGYNNRPFALNIETLKVIDLKFKGNYILGMNNFATTTVIDSQNLNDTQIICFGGFSNDKCAIINMFTKFYLPESVTKPDQIKSDENIKLEMSTSKVKLVKTKSSGPILHAEISLPPVDENCFK